MLRILAIATVAAILSAGGATAASYDIGTIDNGFYRSNGSHDAGTVNTFTGFSGGSNLTYRSFYVFDLGSILADETITSVTMTFFSNGLYRSPDASETLELYDYTGSVATLRAGGSDGDAALDAVYADLGSGTQYGSADVISPGENNPMPQFSVTLNAAALADMNTMLESGADFVIGAMLATVSGLANLEALFSGSTLMPAAELAIETTAPATVPLPPTVSLLLASLGIVVLARRRRLVR